jgi:predicted RNase H-like HicB family nuclease
MAQLAEWPAVVTCAPTVDEARELLRDAAQEMLASFRDEGREPPIGGGHAEQITIDLETCGRRFRAICRQLGINAPAAHRSGMTPEARAALGGSRSVLSSRSVRTGV